MTIAKIGYKIGFLKFEKRLNIPTNWAGMTDKQFKAACSIYLHEKGDAELIQQFFSIPMWMVRRTPLYMIFKLGEKIQYISDARFAVNQFFLTKIGSYHAPQKKLKDITFERWMMLDTFFNDYVDTQQPGYLYRMMACLYLKEDESLMDFDFEKRVKSLTKHVDIETANAVFINMIMIKQWLSQAFPALFPESIKEKPNKRTLTRPKKSNWVNILDEFIGDDIPNTDYYKNMECTRAFRLLNKKILDYERTFSNH